MSVPLLQFSKGEIGPELYARIDADQYSAGAKTIRNLIIQPYGGLASRPGFRLIGELDAFDEPFRLFPFQPSALGGASAFAIAAQDGYARVLTQGGFVLEERIKITAITKAVTALVTAPFHGYAVGDRVFFDGIEGMTEINGREGYVLTTPTDSTFTVGIDTTGYSTFVSSDGELRTATPTPTPTPTPPAPPVIPDPPPETGGGGGRGSGISNPHEQLP